MDAPGLADLWVAELGRLVARAAHELNNALNGAAMNLEVVRLRAVAGRDAGAVAPFAAAAVAEQEQMAALAGAIVALGRTPRVGHPADVREALGHTATLLGAVVRHHGVTIDGVTGDPAPTAAPAHAARLAVAWALGLAAEAARGAQTADAGDRSGVVGCKLVADGNGSRGAALTVAPRPAPYPAVPDDPVPAVLAAHGIQAAADGVALRLTFPAP